MGVAFFLSCAGDLIHVPDSHIGVVIRNPERFGLTKFEIETAYRNHGEQLGIEGEARKELLFKIISQGWIRIRRYKNYWSVSVKILTTAIQGLLHIWAKKMLTGIDGFTEQDRYMPVRISSSDGDFHCTIKDIADCSCPW